MAARLLLRNLGRTTLEVPAERRSTPQGYSYDFYEPSRSERGTVLMVYGFTLAGEKEPRLVRFTQGFSASGFRVAVPDLPGMKALTLERSDLDRIVNMIAHLHAEFAGPIGVIGFSAGGGIALAAAANSQVLGFVGPILLFGALLLPARSLGRAMAKRGARTKDGRGLGKIHLVATGPGLPAGSDEGVARDRPSGDRNIIKELLRRALSGAQERSL